MVERSHDHDRGHDREVSGQIPEDDDLACRGQTDHDQHALTLDAMHRFGIPVGELWLYYLGVGGDVDEYEVAAYLHGLIRLPALARDVISQSVNEMIDDICRGPRAPYSASSNKNTLAINSDAAPDTGLVADPANDPDADLGGRLEASMGAVLGAGGGTWDLFEDDGMFAGVVAGARAMPKEQMLSVVYSSAATQSFSDADLAELLTACRRTNHCLHLTGLLLFRGGRFLQVLEGPEAAVRDRLAIIRVDPRHARVRVLVEETRHERQFPDWTMGYEPISATMFDEVPGYEKAFTDAKDDADPASTVLVLLELIRWFQDRAIPLR